MNTTPSTTVTPNVPTVPPKVKQARFIRDGFRCRSCGTSTDLVADPIVPVSYGGDTDDIDFLRTLCKPCADARFLAEGVPEEPDYPKTLRRVLSFPSVKRSVLLLFRLAALAKERGGDSYYWYHVLRDLEDTVVQIVGRRMPDCKTKDESMSEDDWSFLCSSAAFDAVYHNIENLLPRGALELR